ncbi:hypothetical protein ACX84E_23900 [Burkholderia pseudomallei]|nr:hypothetical protein [Burkholderia pseudomallei]
MQTTVGELAQHAIEQLHLHFDEYMHVACRATAESFVQGRCAYEATYEVCRVAVNMEGSGIAAMNEPDAFTRAVVERAAIGFQLTREEARQAQALNDWGLIGVPAEPPFSADRAAQLAERVLAASLGSRGRE